jgi:Tol biopolymer transport system component
VVERRQVMARAVLTWVAALAAAVVALGMPIQSGHDLFQQALVKERAEGKLQDAIDLYDRIVRDFPEDHALAAKALFQMGQCYEKLGKAEAKKAYERVVRDYADQVEQVTAARSRLAALAGERPTTLTVRRLENPPEDAPMGAPSPDGRYLSFMDWRTGDLTIRDLQTGKERPLTREGTYGKDDPRVSQGAGESAWSPDGQQIAYQWYLGNRQSELRVVGLEGAKPRVLSRYESGQDARCTDWSPDGTQILVQLSREDGTFQIALVSAIDGSTRVLTTMEREIYPVAILFAPDGRHVVYDALPDEASPERDILLVSLETGETTPLIRHPADDFLLGWSADGRWLVFASDRTGALGLWVVGVAGGKTLGTPRLVKEGIGRILPMGLTRQGTLFYGVATATEDVFVADLDPKTGRIAGPARKAIEQNEGGNFSPSYSPDGKFLAYVARGGNSPYPTNNGNALYIRSLETGEERVFFAELWKRGYRWIAGPRWSSDGRFITFGGSRGIRATVVLRLALETGEIVPVFEVGANDVLLGGAYGPGQKHFFARGDKEDGSSRVVVRDLETGEEQELYRFPALERGIRLAVSPDGRWLSFVNAGWGGVRSLKIIPVSGGEAREVWSFGETRAGTPGGSHTWSRDGRYILFSAPDPDDLPSWVLWRVSVEGGNPEKMGLERRWGIHGLTVHPSGRQIALAGRGGPSTSSEVWMIENFLPESEREGGGS